MQIRLSQNVKERLFVLPFRVFVSVDRTNDPRLEQVFSPLSPKRSGVAFGNKVAKTKPLR